MASDSERRRSIERAKVSGLALAGMGLNALLPGAGSLGLRLGQHIVELIAAERIRRLEDFHRRVFEGDVTDEEVTARFRAMEDGDFQHLVSAMLTDIDAEKAPLYSAVYIHLVEHHEKLDSTDRRMWIAAVCQLLPWDYDALQQIAASRGYATEPDSLQRLVLLGAAAQTSVAGEDDPPSGAGYVPDPRAIVTTTTLTKFGSQLLTVLGPALSET